MLKKDHTPIDWNSYDWEREYNPWWIGLGCLLILGSGVVVIAILALIVKYLCKIF